MDCTHQLTTMHCVSWHIFSWKTRLGLYEYQTDAYCSIEDLEKRNNVSRVWWTVGILEIIQGRWHNWLTSCVCGDKTGFWQEISTSPAIFVASKTGMLSSNMTFSKVILCLNLTTPSALPNFFETCCRNQIQFTLLSLINGFFQTGDLCACYSPSQGATQDMFPCLQKS